MGQNHAKILAEKRRWCIQQKLFLFARTHEYVRVLQKQFLLYNRNMHVEKQKIALVHEFLVNFGGAEKTFEAIADLYPQAPIYTAKYDQKNISKMSPSLRDRKIISPDQGLINKASKYIFTFMMAPVFENMDFRDFNLVLSDGNTWNKGILTKPDQLHITYIHTPPRFLYKYSTESTKRNKWYFKLPFSYIDNIFRLWDYVAAQRPDYIIVNSKEVQRRVKKFYNRDSVVIYPPVDVNVKEKYEPNNVGKPYYVAVGRLVKYKNFDLMIEAFNLTGLPLVIVGTGNYENELKKIAGPNITFKGSLSHEEKNQVIHNAMGLVNPIADEDFGIVPVEALAHGVPVLAHKSGGHLETVIEDVNGLFFETGDISKVVQKIKEFDQMIRAARFDKNKIKETAQKFSKERFQKEYSEFVKEKWESFIKSA
jgi:glycosyltransferase involved in cell wall biosynthesis